MLAPALDPPTHADRNDHSYYLIVLQILRMQHGYYAEGDRLFSELVSMVAHVDPRGIHSHVEPITPEELTMANPKNVPPPTDTEPYGSTPAYSPAPTASPAGRGPSGYGAPQGYQPDPYATPAPTAYGAPPMRGPAPIPAGRGAPAVKQARGM